MSMHSVLSIPDSSDENVHRPLARSALQQVPTHGWTSEAITAAAMQDPQLSLSMAGMLNPTELLHWFMDDMNRQLRIQMKEEKNSLNQKLW